MNDLQKLDREIVAAQSEMHSLDVDIGKIRSQIDHAKATYQTGGGRADPVWLARARTALRHKGRARVTLQNQLADLNRRRRTMNRALSERDDGRMFVTCAKAVLDEATYLRIWDEVRIRQTAEGVRS